MNLQKLTPAQTHMILNPIKSKNTDLLKFALYDLLYKEILMLEQEWKFPHPKRRRESLFIYVSRGKKYNEYIYNIHQNIFLESFKIENRRIQLRKLIKEILPLCGNGQGYKALQLNEDFKLFGLFHQTLSFKDFNLFFLNSKGRNLRKKIKLSLNHYNKRLKSNDLTNKEFTEILKELGSNIFLLDDFNSELIEKFNSNFIHGSTIKDSSEYDFDFETIYEVFSMPIFMNMDIIDSFSSSFDSGVDYESSNHDSSSDYSGGDSFDF
ncbi:hypothetical protein EI427_17075 [Flammeovirga pectinis]|uniref:Uncharacterized protein n=1 Tax=Flammeovirga pectinis TaxID=2494373 RepID=A0A3Q9FQS5_9BACT|nr:hypothetical protein [Flammeovirga pectinis]AZQ63876.1 hypothetical protein EI427_17075 [Flammeovirga pectinis]